MNIPTPFPLEALAHVCRSPIQLLATMGFGTPERSRYTEQLRSSGPAELMTFAHLAIATRDATLGAAILSRLDSLPKEARLFSAKDLAQRLVGADFSRLSMTRNKSPQRMEAI